MGLLSELNEARTAMAQKDNTETDEEVKHMIEIYETTTQDEINIYPHNSALSTFLPESICNFGKYLEKKTANIFQIVYYSKDGTEDENDIQYHMDDCVSIKIDNRTPEAIAEEIGHIFLEKTEDITTHFCKIDISFKEFFAETFHGGDCISKEALFYIKDAIEQHIGEFKPTLRLLYPIDWHKIKTCQNTDIYGIVFTVDSPTPLKRNRETE